MMATPRHLLLSPGVSLRELDGYLVAEKPGMRVKVRDPRSVSLLKHASSATSSGAAATGTAGPAEDAEGDATITALMDCGLIETSVPYAPGGSPRTNDYLVSLRGQHEPERVEEVRQRLAGAGVAVVGEPWLGAQIMRALAESGVGRLTSDVVTPSAGESLPLDLVVDLSWPATGSTLSAGAAGGHGNDGIAVLPVVWGVDEIVVGPVLGGSSGRCRECAGPKAGNLGWVDVPRPDKLLGAGLASAAALSYLNGLTPNDILTMSLRYDLRTRQSGAILANGDIACPGCGVRELSGHTAPHPTAQLAWSYEKSVEAPTAPSGAVERWASVKSQSVFRRRHFNMPPLRQIAEARGITLPERVLSLLDSTLETEPVVSRGKTVGIRYRRLPTVEGVGTSSVYVLPRERDGLFHGGAYYDPYASELIPLSWPMSGGAAGHAATGYRLCVTGNFAGAEVCFGRFGRRVVFQDGGLLLAHLLHGGSRRPGLRVAISMQWSSEAIHSTLDLAAGEEALAVLDIDIADADETGADRRGRPDLRAGESSPDAESWLSLGIARLHEVAPSILNDLVLYRWDGDEELSELPVEDGKCLERTPVDGSAVHRDAFRGYLGSDAGTLSTIVIGADMQAVVYQHGASAYASLIQRAAAVAHFLSLVAGERGTASRLMLKLPPRILERSTPEGRSRIRALAALVTSPLGGALPGSSGVEVSL